MAQPAADGPVASTGRLRYRQQRSQYRVRLSTRFLLYSTTLIVVIMGLVVFLVEQRMGEVIVKQARKRGLSIARNLAAVSQPSLVTYNYVALAQNAERAKREEEGIADVIILNKEGRVAAYSQHAERQGTVLDDPQSVAAARAREDLVVPVEIPRDDTSGIVDRGLDISVPVFVENSSEKWGTVRIRLLTEDMHRQIRDTRLMLLVVGLGAVALGVLGSFFMARRITGPLEDLMQGTIRAATGDLDTRIEIRTGDEIEGLARDFNEMIRQIQANQSSIEDLNRGLQERGERLERRSRELRSLHEVGRGLGSTVDPRRILALVAQAARSLSGARAAGVVAVYGTRTAPWWSQPPIEAVLPAREAIEAALLQTRANGLLGPPPELPAQVEARPVVHADTLFGWILLAEAPPLTQDAKDLLEILSGQAGASLNALKLLEEQVQGERLSTIGRMLSTIVHDFRNPMTAIKGYSGMFEEFSLTPERQQDCARLIIEETDRMNLMIEELLEFTRGGQTPLRLTRTTVEELAAKVARLMEPEFKGRGVAFRTELGYAGELVIDVDRMKRAILNIASNALDAMKPGGTFTFGSHAADGRVSLVLADTGHGIPEHVQRRIFEAFFTHGKARGIGLGMSITRKIVEEHGGEISLDSTPGAGTRFTLRLPLSPAAG